MTPIRLLAAGLAAVVAFAGLSGATAFAVLVHSTSRQVVADTGVAD